MIAIWLCTSDSFIVWMDYFSFCKKQSSDGYTDFAKKSGNPIFLGKTILTTGLILESRCQLSCFSEQWCFSK